MRPLLEVRGLGKVFPPRGRGGRTLQDGMPALDGVDLSLERGGALAVVGESGSGKTTLGRCLLRLIEPSAGEVWFDGIDLRSLGDRELRKVRRRFQMVFQDPQSSLDPRMRIGTALTEPIAAHGLLPPRERSAAVAGLLARVGLPAEAAARFPHEFSGGQRQRIAIARALATEPELVVADEPVSSLDASVRAQIVNLLADLQAERGLALLFIAHDLALVEHLADRVAVMFRGRVVELASRAELFGRPQHPYTVELFAAVPSLDPGLSARPGWPPVEAMRPAPAGGCSFRSRCPAAAGLCAERRPDPVEVGPGHQVACHFPGSIALGDSGPGMRRNFSQPTA